jgi:thiol-disulfide isomerase/thioredoxin
MANKTVRLKMRKTFITFTLIFATLAAIGQEIKKIKITDLEKTIAESKTPLIINFWATYCIPCLEEIPYFQEAVVTHKDKEVQLLLVSLDPKEAFPNMLTTFAAKRKLTAAIEWLDEYDADYFCPKIDSAWSGALPASLFINNKTGYRQFLEEQVSKEKLETIIARMVKPD